MFSDVHVFSNASVYVIAIFNYINMSAAGYTGHYMRFYEIS